MAARADKNTTHINKQAAGKWLVGLYQRLGYWNGSLLLRCEHDEYQIWSDLFESIE